MPGGSIHTSTVSLWLSKGRGRRKAGNAKTSLSQTFSMCKWERSFWGYSKYIINHSNLISKTANEKSKTNFKIEIKEMKR